MPNSSTTPLNPTPSLLQRRKSRVDQIGHTCAAMAYMPIAVKKNVENSAQKRGGASR